MISAPSDSDLDFWIILKVFLVELEELLLIMSGAFLTVLLLDWKVPECEWELTETFLVTFGAVLTTVVEVDIFIMAILPFADILLYVDLTQLETLDVGVCDMANPASRINAIANEKLFIFFYVYNSRFGLN